MVKSCTVYMNGDDFYKTMDFRTLSDLKSLGRDLKQKWMYKGYHYYGGEKNNYSCVHTDTFYFTRIIEKKRKWSFEC